MEKIYDGEQALKYLSGGMCHQQSNIRCPCGSGYSHIKKVGTLLGDDDFEAEVYPGTEVIGKSICRRSAVSVSIECEQCKRLFSIVIQQHKGVNFIQVHE